MSNKQPTIFYFSGTGNSYIVARDISNMVSGKLIPISQANETVDCESDTIGIVFPVYYVPFGGLPNIVKQFVYKLKNANSKYIFAVCTYGSGESNTLRYLDHILKQSSAKLSASFSVNMPENIHPHLAYNKHKNMYDVWKNNKEIVCEYIKQKKNIRINLPNTVVGRLYFLLNLISVPLKYAFKNSAIRQLQKWSTSSTKDYVQLIHKMDNSFQVSDKCKGCGTCFEVCPVSNIEIKNNRPFWLHKCEFCLACINWCPNHAITSSAIEFESRYHHPEVKAIDMMIRKK